MTNFIELTYRPDGSKFLVNVNNITYIYPDKDEAVVFVSTPNAREAKYEVKERYDEIKRQLSAF